jgi:4-amino-4-deoxy-L-arabinose transferase-like glycosyltransferase
MYGGRCDDIGGSPGGKLFPMKKISDLSAQMVRCGAALARLGPDWPAKLDMLAQRVRPVWLVIVTLWLLLILPPIFLRAYHYEEGTVIALARGAFEDQHWLVPYEYGLRFPERPVLMSWLLAGLGWLFGTITPVIARTPSVVSLLATAMLVFHLARQRASATGALFGAVCFLICPALLQRPVTAEPDVMLTALLFLAFVIWWNGQKTGQVSFGRWLATGAALSAAALTKGPQPIAYFTLGVGLFLLLRKQWRAVPGFFVANAMAGLVLLAWYAAIYQTGDFAVWALQSRLSNHFELTQYLLRLLHFVGQFALELLPGLLLVPFALKKSSQGRLDDLSLALLCYAATCTAVLVVWPGSGTRYAIPAIPAVATLAGLAYDRVRVQAWLLLNTAVALAGLLAFYGIVVGWIVMPIRPDLFDRTWVGAKKILAQEQTNPAPLYGTFDTANNKVLAYLPKPIHIVELGAFSKLEPPAWAYISSSEVAQVQRLRPDLKLSLQATVHADSPADLYFVQRR